MDQSSACCPDCGADQTGPIVWHWLSCPALPSDDEIRAGSRLLVELVTGQPWPADEPVDVVPQVERPPVRVAGRQIAARRGHHRAGQTVAPT
jgi:hypothetical protein